jgi:hypothetical protein
VVEASRRFGGRIVLELDVRLFAGADPAAYGSIGGASGSRIECRNEERLKFVLDWERIRRET